MGKSEIVQKITEILPKMPDGAEVSVGDLVRCAGVRGEVGGLFEIYSEVKAKVDIQGIKMIPCECEYGDEGVLNKLTFIKESVA